VRFNSTVPEPPSWFLTATVTLGVSFRNRIKAWRTNSKTLRSKKVFQPSLHVRPFSLRLPRFPRAITPPRQTPPLGRFPGCGGILALDPGRSGAPTEPGRSASCAVLERGVWRCLSRSQSRPSSATSRI
jgi:hypothetical protein